MSLRDASRAWCRTFTDGFDVAWLHSNSKYLLIRGALEARAACGSVHWLMVSARLDSIQLKSLQERGALMGGAGAPPLACLVRRSGCHP